MIGAVPRYSTFVAGLPFLLERALCRTASAQNTPHCSVATGTVASKLVKWCGALPSPALMVTRRLSTHQGFNSK